jgi:hypothetical protein
MKFINYLLRSYAFISGFDSDRNAVFVGTANEKDFFVI